MYCEKCGNQLSEGTKFCDKCGAAQEVGNIKPSPTESIPPQVNSTVQSPMGNSTFSQPVYSNIVASMPQKNKKLPFIIIGIVALVVVIVLALALTGEKSSVSSVKKSYLDVSSVKESYSEEDDTEYSKYQSTNSYNISCNGNNDIALEAANVFADKYGGSDHDWNLTNVDASVTGMNGTYRYSYNWAGNSYVATTSFSITDYGTYRNYQWSGDFVDLFYGS